MNAPRPPESSPFIVSTFECRECGARRLWGSGALGFGFEAEDAATGKPGLALFEGRCVPAIRTQVEKKASTESTWEWGCRFGVVRTMLG